MSPSAGRLAPLFSPPVTFPAMGRVAAATWVLFSLVTAEAVLLIPPKVFPTIPVALFCTWAFSSVLTLIAGRLRPTP